MALRFSNGVRSRLLGGGFLGWKRNGEKEDGPPRRAKPTAISVRWNPVALSGRELTEDHARAHELFIAQAALRQARGHLSGSGEEFGFLLGRHYLCRETGEPWIHISETLCASTPFPAGGETDRFRLACVGAKAQAADRGLEVVGWYHEHRYLGATFTDGDRQLHEDVFPEPWHCALVFVTGGTRTAGAFIQPWRGERYYQRALVSFQEVLDEVAEVDDEVRSCIDWSNYASERPVSLLPPEERGWNVPVAEPPPARRTREASPNSEAAVPLESRGELAPSPTDRRDAAAAPAESPARRLEAPEAPPWLRQFEAARSGAAARGTEPVGMPEPTSSPALERPEAEAAAPAARARAAEPDAMAAPGETPAPEAQTHESEPVEAVAAEQAPPTPHRPPIDEEFEEFGFLLPPGVEPRRGWRAWRSALRRFLPGG